MKNGKTPTRRQQEAIQIARLNPDNWLITKALSNKLHLVHRETGREKEIPI